MTKAQSAPVALFVFNRPQQTARVFEAIARARPTRLFIVADGPRTEAERAECEAVREVVSHVDWPCTVSHKYSRHNLGCRRCVASGLDWVFSEVEEAIVLEDDCVPDVTFFGFCSELLEYYRHDTQVMHISGDNFKWWYRRCSGSYYFSKYPHIWGWATWRRAWQLYDDDMKQWPQFRDSGGLDFLCDDHRDRVFWTDWLNATYSGKMNSWAIRWLFACWLHGGISVCPKVNLVENIGFDKRATHTQKRRRWAPNLATGSMRFPLAHPVDKVRNRVIDRDTLERCFLQLPPLWFQWLEMALNRHVYGAMVRKIPIIGNIWARERRQRSQ